MVSWVAVVAAAGLTILSARMMAYAFGSSLGPAPRNIVLESRAPSVTRNRYEHIGSRQIWMMAIEIAFSGAMAVLILGLSFAAAMPFQLMLGALLAQVAIVGSLVAPPVSINFGRSSIRPAAIAMGVAQLAHIVFFLRAIEALLA